ncbi:MAG TPA: MerR family transcriptional regulator [Candidatus Hungatella pullicola]|nr:MerR family transcriptional regulator [Candidatus Hungatella pullicola]
MSYTIGEISKIMGIPASTLRYYDKEGLLPFVKRTSGGIRMFQDKDIAALEVINCLKQTGLSISEIKKFIDLCEEGDSTIDQRLELINRQYQIMKEEEKKIKATIHVLKYKQWYYKTAKEAGTCSIHFNMEKDHVPEEFHDMIRNSEKTHPL